MSGIDISGISGKETFGTSRSGTDTSGISGTEPLNISAKASVRLFFAGACLGIIASASSESDVKISDK